MLLIISNNSMALVRERIIPTERPLPANVNRMVKYRMFILAGHVVRIIDLRK
jgi:hypothetical protein